MSNEFDTLIVNGRIPNFATDTFISAALALNDGCIEEIVDTTNEDRIDYLTHHASEVIDAKGHVVAPGFIDVHMHEENLAETDEYGIGRLMARMGVTTCVAGNCGESPQDFQTFSQWVNSKGGAPVNYLILAGYNSYRQSLSLGTYDKATPEQYRKAAALVREQIEAGCAGVSFGLEYDPGITEEEMYEVVSAVADLDPFVSIHFRADCADARASLEEMARLSRKTQVRVEASHLSSLAGYGYMDEALAFIEQEMAENPQFGYDTYPYTAFSTGIGSAVFDVDWRAKWGCDYDAIRFLYPPYRGQRATRETYEEVRSQHPEQNVVCFAMREPEIEAAIVNPLGLVCSDGGVYAGEAHPRAAGSFPRVIARYVRGTKSLTLMQALKKMSLQAAKRLGLSATKGSIEPGKDADIVIFDPELIEDGSTFDEPLKAPVGIDRVLVGGVTVVKDSADTGALSGCVLAGAGRHAEKTEG
ncbi:amidohydrolase family protein [Olsenella sp. Marseille-QA0557]|uniref:amidohydrolase family protein n=1 Tax=Olsenella sp. Marseille-QA0557 TaxID=3378782 RepID=UPI003D14352F